MWCGFCIVCMWFCNNNFTSLYAGRRDSVVDLATGYGLDDRGFGVRVPVGTTLFFSPGRPDRLWGPHSLLSNG
jgi:hypothetical protein